MDKNLNDYAAHTLTSLIREIGINAEELSETINQFAKLASMTPAETENPNQKSDLEISSQIEVSDEFRNFIDKDN